MACLSALELALMHFNSVSPVSGQATNTFATMDVLSAFDNHGFDSQQAANFDFQLAADFLNNQETNDIGQLSPDDFFRLILSKCCLSSTRQIRVKTKHLIKFGQGLPVGGFAIQPDPRFDESVAELSQSFQPGNLDTFPTESGCGGSHQHLRCLRTTGPDFADWFQTS